MYLFIFANPSPRPGNREVTMPTPQRHPASATAFVPILALWLSACLSVCPGHTLAQDAPTSTERVLASPRQEPVERHPEAVPRSDCFPLEALEPEVGELSKRLLLEALDREALYTFFGPLKPVSEGFWNTRFRIEPLDVSELQRVQQALAAWRCGEIYQADTMVFEQLTEGQRYVSAWVAHRPMLQQTIERKTALFGALGVFPNENPEVVLLSIERSQSRDERWGGFGALFGYPDYAVDFFVMAGKHQATTGEFVERDFRAIPTFESKSGRFVYAVPKLSKEQEVDRAMQERARPILDKYMHLRQEYIGDNKPGVVMLIRDWMDDGSGFCHPEHALRKCETHSLAVEPTPEAAPAQAKDHNK